MTSVRDQTWAVLRASGVRTVFGNPGSTEETFLADFPDDIDYVLGLHEASVLAMADGYAQALGAPAFVNLHTVAGLGNAMGSLVTAYQNKTPLVVTTGQQTRSMLLHEPWLTNIDATTLPKPWVKWSYEPPRAIDVPGAIQRAFVTATQPPHGPCYVSIPLDDWAADSGEAPPPRSTSTRVAPDPDDLHGLATALRTARRPALVFGGGVDRSGGWHSGLRLAGGLDAAVFDAPSSERVSFPQSHPRYRGSLTFAIAELADQLSGYDVVLVVGAPVFRYYPYTPGRYLPSGTQLWQVSDDPDELAKAVVGNGILGDPGLTLDLLAEELGSEAEATWSPAPRGGVLHDADRESGASVSARELFSILARHRPDDAILVEESPSNLADLHREWRVDRPSSFFTFASGALGWGLPASIGIALAQQHGAHRPVVAVIGEGSMQYSIQSLWTAARRQTPLVVVVPDNASYTILKSFAVQERTPGVPGLDLPGLDVAAIAAGYGVESHTVSDPDQIADVFGAALHRNAPTLIRVPIARDVPPLM